jgi:hypothetical protein
LILVATLGGPTMFARIGVMLALKAVADLNPATAFAVHTRNI